MKKGTLFCIIAAVGFGILPTVQNELILHGIPRVSCILYSNACMLAGGLAICRQKACGRRCRRGRRCGWVSSG